MASFHLVYRAPDFSDQFVRPYTTKFIVPEGLVVQSLTFRGIGKSNSGEMNLWARKNPTSSQTWGTRDKNISHTNYSEFAISISTPINAGDLIALKCQFLTGNTGHAVEKPCLDFLVTIPEVSGLMNPYDFGRLGMLVGWENTNSSVSHGQPIVHSPVQAFGTAIANVTTTLHGSTHKSAVTFNNVKPLQANIDTAISTMTDGYFESVSLNTFLYENYVTTSDNILTSISNQP